MKLFFVCNDLEKQLCCFEHVVFCQVFRMLRL
jgi:hypothetical protein